MPQPQYIFEHNFWVEMWFSKKHWRLMLLNCGVGKDYWVPWTERRTNQSILKGINPEYSLERLMLKLKFQYFLATWWEELTHKKKSWCWERLKAVGEGDNRGQDGWMVSLTKWTWVWANSGRWWRTGKPGVCSPWGHKQSHTTERLNNNNNNNNNKEMDWMSGLRIFINLTNSKFSDFSWNTVSSFKEWRNFY